MLFHTKSNHTVKRIYVDAQSHGKAQKSISTRELQNGFQSISLAECKSSILILWQFMLLQPTHFKPWAGGLNQLMGKVLAALLQ